MPSNRIRIKALTDGGRNRKAGSPFGVRCKLGYAKDRRCLFDARSHAALWDALEKHPSIGFRLHPRVKYRQHASIRRRSNQPAQSALLRMPVTPPEANMLQQPPNSHNDTHTSRSAGQSGSEAGRPEFKRDGSAIPTYTNTIESYRLSLNPKKVEVVPVDKVFQR